MRRTPEGIQFAAAAKGSETANVPRRSEANGDVSKGEAHMSTVMDRSIMSILWESPVIRCPMFKQAAADWLHPVDGFCRARPDGQLTIPSVSRYRHRCTSTDYALCETLRGCPPASRPAQSA